MADSDERLRILKMIEEHKITAEEGVRLLSALGETVGGARRTGPGRGAGTGRWLRIRVTDIASARSKASVQVPIDLIDAGMKIGAHFAPEAEGVDMSNLMEAARSGVTGKIIDVTHDRDGGHVETFVE
ncbi:MAG: hypothetical protein V1755_09045 [Chloroflexota bacterium]